MKYFCLSNIKIFLWNLQFYKILWKQYFLTMQRLVYGMISEIRDTFVLVARYACGMFMNKDMRSLWPFYTVSCTVQRRTMANGYFENKRTLRRDATIVLFFSSGYIAHVSTYTCPGITVYWHLQLTRWCLIMSLNKKMLIGDSRRSLTSVCSMMNNAFTFLVNKFLWRLRKQSFVRNNQYCFVNVPKRDRVYSMTHPTTQWYT